VRSLAWRVEGATIELTFELPRGSFATAMLHELLEGAWSDGERAEE
jgi:tRNA(Glu) U13 pseudouridine synthase TruD